MPDYAVPGMKVEERDRNPHPITGVSTSTVAFIGFAASGPFMPTPICGVEWPDARDVFGAGGMGGHFCRWHRQMKACVQPDSSSPVRCDWFLSSRLGRRTESAERRG